jgi:hypothetical protein
MVLDALAAEHVNTIWLTHLTSQETAEVSRRAAVRGISLVAAVGQLAADEPSIRHGNLSRQMASVLADWSDAPRPLAWGLADEPRTAWMGEMVPYLKEWRMQSLNSPATAVVMPTDLLEASTVGFDILAVDDYPFFGRGDPFGLGDAPYRAWVDAVDRVVREAATPWVIAQGFQEPSGPYVISNAGDVAYLPGGGPHWIMPTPAQIRWQAYAGLARGAKGLLFFHLMANAVSQQGTPASKLPSAVTQETNSGSPMALLYPDGKLTPQFVAMGDAYNWLMRHRVILLSSHPSPEISGSLDSPTPGDLLSTLSDASTKTRYLMVVASPRRTRETNITIHLAPNVTDLVSMDGGQVIAPHPSSANPLLKDVDISIVPGGAALFEIRYDPGIRTAIYTDDFATTKYRADAVQIRNLRIFPGDGIFMFTATDGQKAASESYIIYDLDRQFGISSAADVRCVEYDGAANPPTNRGVSWSVSDDGTTWVALSTNDFRNPIFFAHRYIRAAFSWFNGGAPSYGYINHLTFVQWTKSAPTSNPPTR